MSLTPGLLAEVIRLCLMKNPLIAKESGIQLSIKAGIMGQEGGSGVGDRI